MGALILTEALYHQLLEDKAGLPGGNTRRTAATLPFWVKRPWAPPPLGQAPLTGHVLMVEPEPTPGRPGDSPPVNEHGNEKDEAHEGQGWYHNQRDDPLHPPRGRPAYHPRGVLLCCKEKPCQLEGRGEPSAGARGAWVCWRTLLHFWVVPGTGLPGDKGQTTVLAVSWGIASPAGPALQAAPRSRQWDGFEDKRSRCLWKDLSWCQRPSLSENATNL